MACITLAAALLIGALAVGNPFLCRPRGGHGASGVPSGPAPAAVPASAPALAIDGSGPAAAAAAAAATAADDAGAPVGYPAPPARLAPAGNSPLADPIVLATPAAASSGIRAGGPNEGGGGKAARPRRSEPGSTPESARGAAGGEAATSVLPDPDRVGPCPRDSWAVTSPVVRRGIDPLDERPTWWHADGRITKRESEYRVRGADGEELVVPMTMVLTPRPRVAAPDADAPRGR